MPNCVNTGLLQTEAAACLITTPCNTAPEEQPKTPEKHGGTSKQESGSEGTVLMNIQLLLIKL